MRIAFSSLVTLAAALTAVVAQSPPGPTQGPRVNPDPSVVKPNALQDKPPAPTGTTNAKRFAAGLPPLSPRHYHNLSHRHRRDNKNVYGQNNDDQGNDDDDQGPGWLMRLIMFFSSFCLRTSQAQAIEPPSRYVSITLIISMCVVDLHTASSATSSSRAPMEPPLAGSLPPGISLASMANSSRARLALLKSRFPMSPGATKQSPRSSFLQTTARNQNIPSLA